MSKTIVKEDIARIEELTAKVESCPGRLKIERMGGLTNHSYKVQLENGKQYAVRIPGEGTEEMICRADEKISTALAVRLGIDAQLLYFGDDGSKVTEYIKNAQTMSSETMKQEEYLVRSAEILKKLHSCGEKTGVPFEVFEIAASYEKIIAQNHVAMFDDYAQVKNEVMAVKKEIDEMIVPEKVPCHNDPLCENWVLGQDRLYLIDWEYAGMNDGMWDIAAVSIEAGYDKQQDEAFLRAYTGHESIGRKEWKHFLASKIYVDYLWTLWAKTRVPFDGQPMEDWAAERYLRLKKNLREYKAL